MREDYQIFPTQEQEVPEHVPSTEIDFNCK